MAFLDTFQKWFTQKKQASIATIITLILFWAPIRFPMQVGPWTNDFYNELTAVQSGGTVIIGWEMGFLPAPRAFKTIWPALLDFMCSRGLKIICYSFSPEAVVNFETYFAIVNPEEKYGYVWGEDYVIFPFLAGEELALAAVAADLHAIPADVRGNPTQDLPILKDKKVLSDLDLAVLGISSFTFMDMFVRQWPVAYDITTISLASFLTVQAYYGKQILGTLDETRGYAEFEYKIGFWQGEELLTYQIRNAMIIWCLITFVIGNIIYYREKLARSQLR